jgi:hypothetical protein
MTGWFQRMCQSPVAGFLLAAFLSMGIYSLFGFDGWLFRDDAIYVYAGQRFADGIAPYVSIFDHKTPLASILSGIFIFCGRVAGMDDLLAARLGWWLMSGLTGGFMFLLGRLLYRSTAAGLLAAMAFTGFWSFGREVVSGPHAKNPFVLFQVAFFYLAGSGRWGWAGFAAALATWTWQPGLVFVMAAMILPLLYAGKQRDERIRALGRAALGVLVPTIALFGYFILKGALAPLIDGSIFFNLTYLDRHPFDLLTRLREPVEALFNGYMMMAVPGALGLLFLLWQGHVVYHNAAPGSSQWPAWAPMMGVLPVFLLLTFLDFQGTDDLYPILPYMAIGLAGMGASLSRASVSLRPFARLQPAHATALLAAAMALSSMILYKSTSEDGLEAQRVSASRVTDFFPEDRQVASIGLPELMVMEGFTNPNPYLFVFGGVDRKIMQEWPGGIVGFVEDLTASGVEVIGVGQTEGDYRDLLVQALERGHVKHRFGYFDVYVLKSSIR